MALAARHPRRLPSPPIPWLSVQLDSSALGCRRPSSRSGRAAQAWARALCMLPPSHRCTPPLAVLYGGAHRLSTARMALRCLHARPCAARMLVAWEQRLGRRTRTSTGHAAVLWMGMWRGMDRIQRRTARRRWGERGAPVEWHFARRSHEARLAHHCALQRVTHAQRSPRAPSGRPQTRARQSARCSQLRRRRRRRRRRRSTSMSKPSRR
jgi:hypothetical protein